MGISLVNKPTYAPEHVTGTASFLKGAKLTKVTCNILIELQTYLKAAGGNPVVFGDSNYQTSDYITHQNGGGFTDFKVGDNIVVVSFATAAVNGAYTIIEKPSNSTIRVNLNFAQEYVEEQDGIIRVTDEPKAISYRFGLIENDEPVNYASKIDGQDQLFTYEHNTQIPTSFQDMIPRGKKSWRFDSLDVAQVKRVTAGADPSKGIYRFEIQHDIWMMPPTTPNQRPNSIQNVAPSFYYLDSCLKHVFSIGTHKAGYDPNPDQSIAVFDTLGDTAWEGELNNGEEPTFTFESISFANNIDTIDFKVDTDFTIVIDENGGAPVKYADVIFQIIPEADDQFKNIDKYATENFLLDIANTVEADPAVNGYNYGSGIQVLENVQTVSAAGKTTITGTISFGADALTKINLLTDKYFQISAICTSNGLTASSMDTVNVRCALKQMSFDLQTGSVVVDTEFLTHQQNDLTEEGIIGFALASEELVGRSYIAIDKGLNPDALLDRVDVQLVATDGTETVVLRQKVYDVQSEPILSGNRLVSRINKTGFNVRPDEIRANYRLERYTALDSGNLIYYRIAHPFYFLWQYWELIGQLTSPPADLFDPSEEFDGYNQNWSRINDLAGWTINFRVKTRVTVDGSQFTQIDDTPISNYDFDENAVWINESISVLDSTGTPQESGGTPYLFESGIHTIRAEFESTIGPPASGAYFIVIFMLPKEQGTEKSIISCSSVYDRTQESKVYSGLSGDGLVTVTNPSGNILRGEILFDPNKIGASVSDYTFYAWMKSATIPIQQAELFEDTDIDLYEDADYSNYEI